ncbi:hypothetical protein CA603_35445 [Paraburkholderia hospita]|nr:hypothetical protein CA603_35445 [Paraburkholderia hospita]
MFGELARPPWAGKNGRNGSTNWSAKADSAGSVSQDPFRSVEELDMKRVIAAAIIAPSKLASNATFADRRRIGPTRAQVQTVLAPVRQSRVFKARTLLPERFIYVPRKRAGPRPVESIPRT